MNSILRDRLCDLKIPNRGHVFKNIARFYYSAPLLRPIVPPPAVAVYTNVRTVVGVQDPSNQVPGGVALVKVGSNVSYDKLLAQTRSFVCNEMFPDV